MSNLIVDAYYALGRNINKLKGGDVTDDTEQGIVSEKLPELTLDMKNEDLLSVTKKFLKSWEESPVYSDWVKKGDQNKDYWEGRHFSRPELDKSRAQMDNVIFEALQTWIPQTINRNPDPEVDLYPGMPVQPGDLQYAQTMQEELGDLGDELRMRMKLKRVATHWAIYLLGVAKVGWDVNKNIPTIKVVRPRKLILDPNATVDEDGYTGEYIGEHRKLKASVILAVPGLEDGAKAIIEGLVKGDLATEIAFIEWWTNKYMCWTLNGTTVLLKKQNPHWNYDQSIPLPVDDESPELGVAPEGQPAIPEMPIMAGSEPEQGSAPTNEPPQAETAQPEPEQGEAPTLAPEIAGETPESQEPQPEMQTKKGVNHFATPKMPYLLLSMFNLGEQPVDSTSLIGQNLSNQDLINKRIKQIDKNADNMNGGLVVSLERTGLTIEQSKGVSESIRKGGVVAVPAGDPRAAVYRPDTPGLPTDIYQQLVDTRTRVRGIFGVGASSPAGLAPDPTVRGKIMAKTLDTDRMGGGISAYLEQFADDAYDWFVQLKMVYEDKYVQMAEQGELPKVRVSIKEGSLLPRDATTLANQAMQLASENKMALIDLYKAMQYANAEELAVNAWLEVNAPEVLYASDPRVAQVVKMKQAAAAQAAQAGGQKAPSESISFKDLPPDGKVQLAAKAGITLHPEGVAAHEQLNREGTGSNAEMDAAVAPANQP